MTSDEAVVHQSTAARPFLEVAAVVVTGVLHLVLVEVFNARALFIGLALTGWPLYIVARISVDRR